MPYLDVYLNRDARTARSRSALRDPIANLAHHRDEIRAALDFLFTGY